VTFVLPQGLAPEVYPLAWLVGTWRGDGLLAYPGIEESAFRQELVVASDGGPYLSWSSTWRLLLPPDDAGGLDDAAGLDDVAPLEVEPLGETATGTAAAGEPEQPVWAAETGFWRIPPQASEELPAGKHPVELLVADPSGHVAIYVGAVGDGRIDLVSDVVVHTATGAQVAAGSRLYGLVGGELMWAHDLAAFGHPMQSYASARLTRVTS
jgi:hypothetical protein